MAETFALSTIDNPFDPINDFDNWLMFDLDNHYYSCSLLMRFAYINNEFSDPENDHEIERAIDEIIKIDPTNKFVKFKYRNGVRV